MVPGTTRRGRLLQRLVSQQLSAPPSHRAPEDRSPWTTMSPRSATMATSISN